MTIALLDLIVPPAAVAAPLLGVPGGAVHLLEAAAYRGEPLPDVTAHLPRRPRRLERRRLLERILGVHHPLEHLEHLRRLLERGRRL